MRLCIYVCIIFIMYIVRLLKYTVQKGGNAFLFSAFDKQNRIGEDDIVKQHIIIATILWCLCVCSELRRHRLDGSAP